MIPYGRMVHFMEKKKKSGAEIGPRTLLILKSGGCLGKAPVLGPCPAQTWSHHSVMVEDGHHVTTVLPQGSPHTGDDNTPTPTCAHVAFPSSFP